MTNNGNKIYVPFDLALQHQDVYKAVSVYLAVLTHCNDNGRAVISLRDIIYSMCFTPARGKNCINKKIAGTINKLRDLGYFEIAPDYLAMDRIESAEKFGFKVADIPYGIKTHCVMTKTTAKKLLCIKRIPMLLNDDKRAFTLKFCAEAAIRCYIAIYYGILEEKGGAAYVPRAFIAKAADLSEATVTNTTAFLVTADLIRKKISHRITETGAVHRITYYTIYKGSDEDAEKRLRSISSEYMYADKAKGKTIGGEPVKVSDWGKYKDWV